MQLGRLLVYLGAGILALGLLVMLGSKLGFPWLGRLPGDLVFRGKNTTVYVPIVTSILLSILLTLILMLFSRR